MCCVELCTCCRFKTAVRRLRPLCLQFVEELGPRHGLGLRGWQPYAQMYAVGHAALPSLSLPAPRKTVNTTKDAARLALAAASLHEELQDTSSAHLKAAVAQMETMNLRAGGGGKGSMRTQLTKLTGEAERLKTFLQGDARPAASSELPPAPTLGIGVARHEFVGSGPTEISCRRGDMLTVLDQPPPAGWLVVRTSDGQQCGLVPRAYVEIRVRVPRERVGAQAVELKDAYAQQARVHEREIVDVAVARYLHCTVEEWRRLPEPMRPQHLMRMRSWDGKKIE